MFFGMLSFVLTILLLLSRLECSGGFSLRNIVSSRRGDFRRICMIATSVVCVSQRVKDLEKSLSFYSNALTLEVQEKSSRSALLNLGIDIKSRLQLIEDTNTEVGDSYVGLGLKVSGAIRVFDASIPHGGSIITELNDMSYGASMVPDEDEMKQNPVRLGSIRDPDGYVIEVMEEPNKYPASKIVLNVLDLNESIEFYSNLLGMTLFRKRSNVNNRPRHGSMCAYVGYGPETSGPALELVYNYATEKLDHRNGFMELTLGTDDITSSKLIAAAAGKDVVDERDGGFSLLDPSGYKVHLVPISG